MSADPILLEQRDRVVLIRLNRPAVLNALNSELIARLSEALEDIEKDPAVSVSIITGSAKAFAAGVDIAEMQNKQAIDAYMNDFLGAWDGLLRLRKPIIAAVAGFALGGGCELAMLCDLILAADNAKFGQPEVKLGVIPGAGGTQRLVRAIGKAKAMDMCLTGRMIDAGEAEKCGLVARIVPVEELEAQAWQMAHAMAAHSLPALMAAKECVQRADEMTLAEGLRYERNLFKLLFAGQDQKEGMRAFLEKRPAQFRHR